MRKGIRMENTSRRDFLKAAGLCGAAMAMPWAMADEPPQKKLNILFIAVDDLRTELGCYGSTQVKTPNIDRLASEGTLFERAYCQQAVCNPSRVSLLTGKRPDTTKVWDLKTFLREPLPDVVTLPQHFMNHGYHSQGMGKIYHQGHGIGDDKLSWSVPHKSCGAPAYHNPENLKLFREARASSRGLPKNKRKNGPPADCADVADNAYGDGVMTDLAIKTLRRIKDKPFFLATGFRKPHLPFCAPKKYWDLYKPQEIVIPERKRPEGAPPAAFSNWGELRKYHGMPAKGPLTDEQTRHLIHGYYACVSYIDAQVGRILDELDRLALRDNTAIVLWGDHGWKLGEYGDWCKHTNFELDAHAPLILSAPGQKVRGTKTSALVEFIDIYPTLCDLAGLPIPEDLEGVSMVPLLDDPDLPWKLGAVSQYPRREMMGYSLRTRDYRYTEWKNRGSGEVMERELYDQTQGAVVSRNVAAGQPELVEKFSALLNGGFDKLRPPAR